MAYIVMELGSICLSTCLIVPFVRYRRVKALAQRRIDHIEARDAEEAGEDTEDEDDSQKEEGDDSSDEDDEIVGLPGSSERHLGLSSGRLSRTVSSVNYSKPTVGSVNYSKSAAPAPSPLSATTSTSSPSSSLGTSVTSSSGSSRKIVLIEDDDDQASSALHTPSTVIRVPAKPKPSTTSLLLMKQGAASAAAFMALDSKPSLKIPSSAAEDAHMARSSKLDDEQLPNGARRLPKSLSKFRAFDERTKQRDMSQLTVDTTNITATASSKMMRSSHSSMLLAGSGGAQQKVLPQNFLGLKYDYLMEQKALLQLSIVQFVYGILIQAIIVFSLVIFSTYNDKMADLMLQHDDNKWWWSVFMAGSSTSNLGFCYWEEGLTAVKDIPPVTLVLIFGVIAGNTCVPLFMRFFVWFVRNITPQRYQPKHSQPLRCLLNFPPLTTIFCFSCTCFFFFFFHRCS